MYQLLIVIALVFVVSAVGQMCQNPGKQCFANSDCCGGCCMRSICLESTRNCLLDVDDCVIFHCPPGMSCRMFQMPGCPGCPLVPYCREDGD